MLGKLVCVFRAWCLEFLKLLDRTQTRLPGGIEWLVLIGFIRIILLKYLRNINQVQAWLVDYSEGIDHIKAEQVEYLILWCRLFRQGKWSTYFGDYNEAELVEYYLGDYIQAGLM